ncbi:MbtH family NRPS accessory protein [Streptomyces atratus]|nr:MbtH family NRPS accessory protein [Streptomyces atratus]
MAPLRRADQGRPAPTWRTARAKCPPYPVANHLVLVNGWNRHSLWPVFVDAPEDFAPRPLFVGRVRSHDLRSFMRVSAVVGPTLRCTSQV